MTVPSHPAGAMFLGTICWTEQPGAQMRQKGFVVNNNLRRRYSDFSVFCVFNSIFVFLFFFRCKVSKYAAVSVAVKVKIVFNILTFEPIFHPRPHYAILTHGITKGWLCIDGSILSIWLNQHPAADYER